MRFKLDTPWLAHLHCKPFEPILICISSLLVLSLLCSKLLETWLGKEALQIAQGSKRSLLKVYSFRHDLLRGLNRVVYTLLLSYTCSGYALIYLIFKHTSML